MDKISEIYKSKYLAQADIADKELITTIKSIGLDSGRYGARVKIEIEDGRFLTLNATSARELSKIYGDEFQSWVGKKIKIEKIKQMINGTIKSTLFVSASDLLY